MKCLGCGASLPDICHTCGLYFAHDGDTYDVRGPDADALRAKVYAARAAVRLGAEVFNEEVA